MTERTVVQTGFSGTHLILAVLGGAAAGAAVALLTAPKSGRETRARIKETLREARNTLNDVIDDGTRKVRHLPGAAKSAGVAAGNAFVTAMDDSHNV